MITGEGPVHLEEIARRVAAAFGKKGLGSRIITATRHALAAAKRADAELLQDAEEFWFSRAQSDQPPVRDRSGCGPTIFRIDAISMSELQAAVRLAREGNPGAEDAELIRATAHLLGSPRVGPDVHARILRAVG